MRCVVVREHGGVDRLLLEERSVPTPGPGQVRLRMQAIGLNHLDTWVRRGVPGHTFPLPLVMSSDGCGVIDAVGPGAVGVQAGDPVVVLPGLSCGACDSCQLGLDQFCRHYHILGESCDGTAAEFVCLPVANVAPKPRALSAPEAAAICLVFQTAWNMLVRRAELRAGETVLVHAGLSGVGSAAVQIAKLLGAQVIATAGGPEKCRRVTALGADHVIDHHTADVAATVRSLTGKAGVQVVFEHTGAATFETSLKVLQRGGRLVTCGATTGGNVPLSLHAVFFKSLSILGSTMGSKGDLRQLLRLFDQGRLRPVLDRTLPLQEVATAQGRPDDLMIRRGLRLRVGVAIGGCAPLAARRASPPARTFVATANAYGRLRRGYWCKRGVDGFSIPPGSSLPELGLVLSRASSCLRRRRFCPNAGPERG
jgi:NADPH:quinone reductase-like Zn-dependent oxidoreductase